MCLSHGYKWIWVVFVTLCYALLLFFFIDTRMRANHDHNRRFDRLDLHPPSVRPTLGAFEDKTIKLGFDFKSIVRLLLLWWKCIIS